MKPIKPKPLPKRLETALRATADAASSWATMGLERRDARAVRAALEHAKQQTQRLRDAAECYALHECSRDGKCRECREFGKAMDATKP